MQSQNKKSPLSCEKQSLSSKKRAPFQRDHLHEVVKQKNFDYFSGEKKRTKKSKKKKKIEK